MSTKSTFVLSEDNEHIYYDCSDETIIFEFNRNHIELSEDNESLVIQLNPDSDLYNKLSKIFWLAGWCGSNPVIND